MIASTFSLLHTGRPTATTPGARVDAIAGGARFASLVGGGANAARAARMPGSPDTVAQGRQADAVGGSIAPVVADEAATTSNARWTTIPAFPTSDEAVTADADAASEAAASTGKNSAATAPTPAGVEGSPPIAAPKTKRPDRVGGGPDAKRAGLDVADTSVSSAIAATLMSMGIASTSDIGSPASPLPGPRPTISAFAASLAPTQASIGAVSPEAAAAVSADGAGIPAAAAAPSAATIVQSVIASTLDLTSSRPIIDAKVIASDTATAKDEAASLSAKLSSADVAPASVFAATPSASTQPAPAVAPAAAVFAAAIHAAGRDRGETGGGAADASPFQAMTLAGSTAATDGVAAAAARHDQPTLDLRHGDWPGAMIEHIEKLRDAANATDTRIRVVPDALGGIDVGVRRGRDGVEVTLTADQSATRAILAEARPQLTQLAEARGIRLADTQVAGGGGAGASGADGWRQSQAQSQPQHRSHPHNSPRAPAPAARSNDDPDATTTRVA